MMPQLKFIDLFCGAGGWTTGIERATYLGQKCAEVVACINHDDFAIRSHKANHPNALHFTEDIRTFNLQPLVNLVKKLRSDNPNVQIWKTISCECTNFSIAKGGMSKDNDSRTLPEDCIRYIEALQPEGVIFENVKEFLDWCPLEVKVVTKRGKKAVPPHCPLQWRREKKKVVAIEPVWVPVKALKGTYYKAWVKRIEQLGYRYEYRILNAADFGAYTSRKRYFGQFVREGIPMCFPEPTHAKTPTINLKKWKAVRRVLNLDHTGDSIFVPGRITSDKTFERIYHGLIKFVAGGKKEFEAFLMKFNSTATNGSTKHSTLTIDNPAPTIDTQRRTYIINPVCLSKYFSGQPEHKNISVDAPSGSIRCKDGTAIVQAEYIMNPIRESRCTDSKEPIGTVTASRRHWHYLITYKGQSKSHNINEPCNSVTTGDNIAFVSAYYGSGHNCSGIDSAAPTVTGGDRFVLISPQFIFRQFSEGQPNQSIDEPSGSVATVPKLNLVTADFLMDSQFGNEAKSIDDTAPTQTANRKHFYLINPQWFNEQGAKSIDQPCFSIIASQDKAPAILVCAETGFHAVEIFENDLPHAIAIKAFMALYGIVDIKMRMLEIVELLRIQGFIEPHELEDAYLLIGSKTKKKWMLGNAVEVTQAKAIIEAVVNGMVEQKQMRVA